jgi:hypothetical protein
MVMVRLAILLVLLCLAVWEWRGGVRKAPYWLALLGLFVIFSLRYGQGTDYLTYLSIYANVPPLQTLPNYAAFLYNKVEPGFFYLMSLFRMFGLHYAVFVAAATLFSLLCVHRFIQRFAPLPMLGLLVFYAVYSLVYMESAIRQMLALAIALGFIFPLWANGRRFPAMILMAVGTMFHMATVVLFLLPVLFWQPRRLYLIEWKRKTLLLALAGLAAATVIINFIDLTPVIRLMPALIEYTILEYYVQSGMPSLLALGNRTLFMAIVLGLAWRARARLTAEQRWLVNLYCVGYGLYLLFMSFDLIASRTGVYFRILDVALLPLLLHMNRDLVKRSLVAMPVLLMLLSFLYVKDIAAVMDYAGYYSSNPVQYPYITVFNPDALLDNKFVNVKNANAMNAYQTGGFSWNEYYGGLMRKPSVRSPILPY